MAKSTQRQPRQWSENEIAHLRVLYPTTPAKRLMPMLPGRTERSIRNKAAELKIGKITHSPKFVKPIGSERMDRGYLIRKVSNTGNPKQDWKRVEVIEWEAQNGPIPPKLMLMVKNPALPRTLENMGLFTHAQHWERVGVQTMHPGIRQLVQLKGQITQAINRRMGARRKAQ